MPRFTVGDLDGCFTGKLGGEMVEGGKHRRYRFFDDEGRLVASTALSRSWRAAIQLSPGMVGSIQRDLQLQGASGAFDLLIRCPMSRADWLRLIGGTVQ